MNTPHDFIVQADNLLVGLRTVRTKTTLALYIHHQGRRVALVCLEFPERALPEALQLAIQCTMDSHHSRAAAAHPEPPQ